MEIKKLNVCLLLYKRQVFKLFQSIHRTGFRVKEIVKKIWMCGSSGTKISLRIIIIFQSHYALYAQECSKNSLLSSLGNIWIKPKFLMYIFSLNVLQYHCIKSWLSKCIMWYWMSNILLTVNLSFIADRIHRRVLSRVQRPHMYISTKLGHIGFFLSFHIMTLLPTQHKSSFVVLWLFS